MIAFKCKICGGNLEIEQGERVSTCQSCGSTHSLPNLESDKVRNLFERANQLRFNHQFDKAMGVYETIITDNPNDPEVYWSLVLCRYGVEYVEDPKSNKRIITTHRTLPQSVLRDTDYQQAIKLASSETKRLYEEEAVQIDTIQKGILSISNQEDPYDIFICYKETDDKGKRTLDSVLGQRLYEELIDEGFKVFFAKISLEDKLGQEYEPYIYSALKTSKVMLVLGTQKDYFEAPWVRNEWNRFLTMMKEDKKKTLIPLYRDIDAYALPEEFRIFQSQDLNKVGASQDLVRGIRKLIPAPSVPEKEVKNVQPSSSSHHALLKRAFLALEDREFDAASNYAENVLNLDPELPEAYLIKFLADNTASSIDEMFEEVVDNQKDFIKDPSKLNTLLEDYIDVDDINFKKIMKFGKQHVLPTIYQTVEKIKKRIINLILNQANDLLASSNLNLSDRLRDLVAMQSKLKALLNNSDASSLLFKISEEIDSINADIAIREAKEQLLSDMELYDDVLKILEPYQNQQKVKNVLFEFKQTYDSFNEQKAKKDVAFKKETYQKIVDLIKHPSIKHLSLARHLIYSIKGYEDCDSLDEFALKKFIELKSIQQKKVLKVSLLSLAGFILLSLASFSVDKYLLSEYQIHFNANGGTTIEPGYLNFGETISEPTILPYKEGHSFVGWYTDSQLTTPFEFGKMPANNLTVYAKWSINQYTINFQSNGGTSIDPITQDYGTSVIAPVPPTKTGHTFVGWYRDEALSIGYNFTTMQAESSTAYAKWSVNQYRLDFQTNGGSTINSQMNFYNENFTLPITTKIGHTFLGWFQDSGLSELFTLNKMPANNLTVYAKWSINQYTINFQSNGGTSIDPITQDYGTSVTTPVPPTKTGHTFAGWFTDIDLSIATPETMPASNITFYAKWSVNEYTITYNTNGGNPIFNQTRNYGESLSLPTPTKVGHSFVGWYEDSALTRNIPDTMPAENITVYAKWRINEYTISFQTNGGTNLSPITQDYGTSVIAPTPPTKTGYTFMGWYRDEALSIIYSFTTIFAENPTLYAKWGFDFSLLSMGNYHSSALNATGRVFMWGRNSSGQLGDGTTSDKNVPTEITSRFPLIQGDKITSLSLGSTYSSALSLTGRVFMWGRNSSGQLGDGTTSDKNVPTEITSRFPLIQGDKITSLSAGPNHSSALSATGRVFMWGSNQNGQLGDGTIELNTFRIVPFEITSKFILNEGDKVISLFLNGQVSSALTLSGRVFMWGSNIRALNAVLGDGTTVFNRNVPTEITSRFSLEESDRIVSLSLGHDAFSSALSATGRVFMWGYNSDGQLGDGTTLHRSVPIEITKKFSLDLGDKIISLSLGNVHSSALSATGRIFMWGANSVGQLGDGTTSDKNVPTEITSRFPLIQDDKITSLSLGSNHSSALSATGRLYIWGWNYYGQLGDGNDENSYSYIPIVIYKITDLT